jgi:hypothetical protein
MRVSAGDAPRLPVFGGNIWEGSTRVLGALDIKGRVDTQFGGGIKDDDDHEQNIGLNINAHLWPSYNLGIATVGLDLGFEFLGENTDKDGDVIGKGTPNEQEGGYRFGGGLWLKKTIGGASIKGGIGYSMGEVHGVKQDSVFSFPIIFDYSF